MSKSDIELPKTLPKFVLYFIKRFLGMFFFYQLFCLIWAVDNTLWPYIFGIIIDRISSSEGNNQGIWDVMKWPMIWAGITYFVINICYRASGFIGARLYPKMEASVRMKMFDYVQYHSYNFYLQNMAGTVANKISDMPQAMYALIDFLITIIIPVVFAAIISIAIFYKLQPLFGLILLAWIVVHIAICIYASGPSSNLALKHSESRSILQGRIVDNITNSINVRTFARQLFEMSYIRKFQEFEKKNYFKALFYNEYLKVVLSIINIIFIALGIGWFTIESYRAGNITIGDVILIFNTSFNINLMVWMVGLELPFFLRQVGICKQAMSIITAPHEIIDEPDSIDLKVTKGKIEFDNVTFNYSRNNNIFQNKSIILNPGEKVGLVGYSGSGKTTFVNLILRYFDIADGRILIDDQDITTISMKSLRESISIIPQDPVMFHRSIKENIRYGKIDASDEEVIQAAKKAHCHEFVMKQPQNYDFVIGERGLRLSGGQRQRLAIARAILKNAPILIMDEATSALDSISESLITDSMYELTEGKTTIIIAHRLATLASCDRILVFDQGSIKEDGSHEELLEIGGHYAAMWHKQIGGFLPEQD